MTCQSVVIVGSGIAGIYSALLAKTKYPNAYISLVEKSEQLGGLLSSKKIDGHWFDYGTHVPRYTGDTDIDALLFSSINLSDYWQFQNINAANVGPFNTLYTDSPNPFLGSKANTQLAQQLLELTQENNDTRYHEQNFDSLKSQLDATYGPNLTKNFFAPLMNKRFGACLSEMATDSHKIIGLQRLILGDGELMRKLKGSPRLDEILAFASQEEGLSPFKNIYPKGDKGIHVWIDSLVANLENCGVNIYTQTGITELNMTDDRVIKGVVLSSGQRIDCNLLVWTAPLNMLIQSAKLTYMPSTRPIFRTSSLYHFVFPDPPKISSNYVNVHDPAFSSFRVTLYSNLAKTTTDAHRVTVEVMHDIEATAPSRESICQELYDMGIMPVTSRPSLTHVLAASSGFPVLTPAFKKEMGEQEKLVETKIANVVTLGKASGTAFFMADVLKEAKCKLNQYFERNFDDHNEDNIDKSRQAVSNLSS